MTRLTTMRSDCSRSLRAEHCPARRRHDPSRPRRNATPSERERAERFIASYAEAEATAAWAAFARVLLSSNEFLYIE